MSENNGVVLQSIVGSSYEGKFKVVSPEISLNMFVEPIAADNEGYTSKILKSIDGNEAVMYFGPNTASKTPSDDFTFGVGCRGMYASSSSPDGVPYLYAVFDNNLWRIKPRMGADDCIKIGSLGATNQPVRFAESGGGTRSCASPTIPRTRLSAELLNRIQVQDCPSYRTPSTLTTQTTRTPILN